MIIRRREILRAGLAAVGGYFSGCAQAASRLANEQLQVGVIGVGNHGATNLNAVARHAQVVALADVDDGYRQPAAAAHPSAKTFRDFRELLELEELDAVVISTPDHTHACAALQAMKRGLHVFCEKPLTHTLDELERLLKLARQAKVVTQTGMQHHVREGTARAAAILRAGMLGEIKHIHAWTDRPIWPQNINVPDEVETPPKTFAWDLWLGPAKERDYHAAYHPLRWRGWHDFGSGALGDFGPHLLDAVFWGLELPPPATIEANTTTGNAATYPVASVIHFGFPKTPTRPAIQLTWYDGGEQPSRKIHGLRQLPPNGVLVLGQHGQLFIPDYGRTPRLLNFQRDAKLPAPLERSADIHADWVEACRTTGRTCLPFAAAAPLMQTCLLGNIALRARETIGWDSEKRQIAPAKHAASATKEYRSGWRLPDAT